MGITGIAQNEPTNGIDDGDTCPDALALVHLPHSFVLGEAAPERDASIQFTSAQWTEKVECQKGPSKSVCREIATEPRWTMGQRSIPQRIRLDPGFQHWPQ